MNNQLKSINLGGWIEVYKGVVLVINIKLRSRIRFNLKENLGVLSSRLRKEVVPRMAILLVQIVARNIMESVYCVQGVALVVVRMGTT